MTLPVLNPVSKSLLHSVPLDRWVICKPDTEENPEYWAGTEWVRDLRDARQYRALLYVRTASRWIRKKYPDIQLNERHVIQLYVNAGCDKVRLLGQ